MDDKVIINKMLDALVHRGPDNRGIYQDDSAVMGFQRLAIIDLQEASNQPMSDTTGRFVITFNGEIYNYRHLRTSLEKQGYKFKTNSDTEVLLQMFIEKGEACLQYLNGMFAFVIYDKQERSIFMAKDRAGKKPLFYTYQSNRVYVASELKAILAAENIDKQLEMKMIFQYLGLGYNIAPDTVIEKIKKLKPGHYIKIYLDRLSDIEQRNYWQICFNNDLGKRLINDIEEELFDLLLDSARLRLQSDVPLALFLSGGLDSSAIASILASSGTNELHAFTIDFDDKSLSELETVNTLVRMYPNIVHHVLKLEVNNMLNNLDLLEKLDEPLSDSSFIPTYWISKLVKDAGFTVALSGDGGDELLAGYFKDKPFDLIEQWYKISNKPLRLISSRLTESNLFQGKIEDIIRRMSLTKEEYYWYTRVSFKFNYWGKLFKRGIYNQILPNLNYSQLFPSFDKTSRTSIIQIFENGDFKYRLPDCFLTKVDRASMLNSMEVRNPFLDYRIIELLSHLPFKFKLSGNQTKYVLRYMLLKRGLVTQKVLRQRKMGFSLPLRSWVHNDLKELIKDTILSGRLGGWINPSGLEYFFKTGEKLSMHNELSETIWRIYIISIYLNKYNLSL